MKIIILLLVGIVILIILGVLFITYSMRSASSLNTNEEIKTIDYSIIDYGNADFVTAKIYLNEAVKLAGSDTLTVNGQEIKPEWFNNGISAGYKYEARVKRGSNYELLVSRAGEEAIKRELSEKSFSTNIPDVISKSEDLVLAYTASDNGPDDVWGITLDSLDREESVVSNKEMVWGLSFVESVSQSPIVVPATQKTVSVDASIKDLKNTKLSVRVAMHFEQRDGTYVVGHTKEVEIVD